MQPYASPRRALFGFVAGLILLVFPVAPAHAAPEDCLENGGQAQCVAPIATAGEWQHNLCDESAGFVRRYATWCSVLGGIWQGNYAPCLGENTHIVEAEVFPYAEAFARQIHNVQHCTFQGEDRGWLSPGHTLRSDYCTSGGPTFQNGMEVGNLREILFAGQGVDIYTQSCDRNFQERIIVTRRRSIQPGCPADFSLRTNGAGQSECYKLSACQVSLVGLPAEVEPGRELTGLEAQVTCNGQPQAGITVALESKVIPYSGGHQHHNADRKPGEAPATVLSGDAFAFAAPIVAGDHEITARCMERDCGGAAGRVWVGHKGLQRIGANSAYRLIPNQNKDPGHPDNHYLTLLAASRLGVFAALYNAQFSGKAVLHLNDASLVWGGYFDFTRNWGPPHHEHCRGGAIDIRANGAEGALDIASYDDRMIKEMEKGMYELTGVFPKFEVPKNSQKEPVWGAYPFLCVQGISC